jgi:hypothetical protein
VDSVTLVIAVFGAVTGAASLGWSVASHVLTGGRVKVELLAAWSGEGTMLTTPLKRTPMVPDRRFVFEPHLAVRVRNTGRLPVAVEQWGISLGPVSVGHAQHRANEPVPKVLNPGESKTWLVPLEDVVKAAAAIEHATGQRTGAFRAKVSLGTGKERHSGKSEVSVRDLHIVFPDAVRAPS